MVDKIWDQHAVTADYGGQDLLYVDMHLIHEVTSPQAFEGLRGQGRTVKRPDLTLATVDHNVPTTDRSLPVADSLSARQMEVLEENCDAFSIPLFNMFSPRQGIVHMVGPELGLTLPGMTIVCGDSHTSTHGAFGALAFGIGTSEVEHVLATQTLPLQKPATMLIECAGTLGVGVTAKDLILGIIRALGTDGGSGFIIEYRGDAISSLTMEGRMTVCNMSIEAGARAGLIAPDRTTFEYLRGRPHAPSGSDWSEAIDVWQRLPSDPDAEFDKVVELDVGSFAPTVTWGTTPAMSVSVDSSVPFPEETNSPEQARQALDYMGLAGGEMITEIPLDRIFIGSCTNARIEDLRSAAAIVAGKQVSPGVRAMVVPGSMGVKAQAEREGLAEIFRDAGFEWREPGCSMCLGMNPDILAPGERCASTSNRNFEGRQGKGGRTHLVSPAMAAAAALHGHFVDVRQELP